MTVYDLNDDQLNQLKEEMVTEKCLQEHDAPSYGELLESHEQITDEEVYKEYDGVEFSEDDFWT